MFVVIASFLVVIRKCVETEFWAKLISFLATSFLMWENLNFLQNKSSFLCFQGTFGVTTILCPIYLMSEYRCWHCLVSSDVTSLRSFLFRSKRGLEFLGERLINFFACLLHSTLFQLHFKWFNTVSLLALFESQQKVSNQGNEVAPSSARVSASSLPLIVTWFLRDCL